MKIILTIPSYDIDEFYPDYQGRNTNLSKFGLIPGVTHPLGLSYISSSLKKSGHEVNIIDGAFESEYSLLRKIIKIGPDLIGIQVSTPLWQRTKKFSRQVKNRIDTKIAVGGPHITCAGVETIEEEKSVDFGIEGDGELVLSNLCNELEGSKKTFETAGLGWKNNGQLIKNEPIPNFVENLDELSFPDRTSINLDKYCPSIGFYRKRPSTNMVTTRGCRMSCEFCHARNLPLRQRSIDNVIEELEELDKMGIEDIIIYDQDFGQDKKRAKKICRKIIDRNFDFYMGGNLRIDSFDEELVRLMKEAGFWRIFYGIESGVQKNLDTLRKGIKLDDIRRVVQKTDNLGIHVFGSFILGIPDETFDEGLKTIEFAKELPLTFAKFLAYSPWPRTEVWKNSEKFGTLDKSSKNLGMNLINFVPKTMEKDELTTLLKKAYKEFYLRPTYMLKRLSQIRTKEDIKQNIRGLLSFVNIS